MSDEEEKPVSFQDMGLDDRLLKAIAKLGWAKPTLIQEKAIPLALEGKDILARARTGSGKTGAFTIPMIHRILKAKEKNHEYSGVSALILVPSKELCRQTFNNLKDLANNCGDEIKIVDVSSLVPLQEQKVLLQDNADIVVGTPSRIFAHLEAANMSVSTSLKFLAIDEADLLFSFGYEDDVKSLLSYLPRIYQAFLMSATLSEDVKALKKLVLHNPLILKLEESQLPSSGQLSQYHIKCEEDEKFVLIYTLLKLNLVQGKTILFVNTVDKAYRLKIFLEQFAIRSCVLNSELPASSRCHIVHQFNKGVYDSIIASDEKALQDPASCGSKKKKRQSDKESGVSRGIDFHHVANVINFDFPPDVDSYIHRVGRTARGDNEGTALSFISMKEAEVYDEVEKTLNQQMGSEGESVFKPYKFKMEEIEGFRYRANDAMRAVTRRAVKEARLKEIRQELLNSEKLKPYFEDNPRDLQLLRHDKALHVTKLQDHLKHVPDYIVPPALRGIRNPLGFRRKRKTVEKEAAACDSKAEKKFKKEQADVLVQFETMKRKRARAKGAKKS